MYAHKHSSNCVPEPIGVFRRERPLLVMAVATVDKCAMVRNAAQRTHLVSHQSGWRLSACARRTSVEQIPRRNLIYLLLIQFKHTGKQVQTSIKDSGSISTLAVLAREPTCLGRERTRLE